MDVFGPVKGAIKAVEKLNPWAGGGVEVGVRVHGAGGGQQDEQRAGQQAAEGGAPEAGRSEEELSVEGERPAEDPSDGLAPPPAVSVATSDAPPTPEPRRGEPARRRP